MTIVFLSSQRPSRWWASQLATEPKQCYLNAFRLLSLLPSGSTYVEGLAMIRSIGIPLEHGWCRLPAAASDAGEIIDVSWVPDLPRDDLVAYLGIRTYELPELMRLVMAMEHPTLPLGWMRGYSVEGYLQFLKQFEELPWPDRA